jgi:hypothetical protein
MGRMDVTWDHVTIIEDSHDAGAVAAGRVGSVCDFRTIEDVRHQRYDLSIITGQAQRAAGWIAPLVRTPTA